MRDLRFEPLASSSAGCCYRLSGGGTSAPLLIDAGIRFELIQRGLNFRVSALAGCLLTHAHGDHAKAVDGLLRAGVDVYSSKETWASVWPRLTATHRAKELYSREQTSVGDWSVLPFEAVHDAPGTLGFLIGSPDGCRLLFLTDSAYSPYRFEGLTHIAIECNWSSEILRDNVSSGQIHRDRYRRISSTHMSLERLIEMLKANDLSAVEEIHLLHLSSQNSDEAKFKLEVERATGKPVYVAAETSAGVRW
jgi:phosphoribosyl 1,2-cyclic phosphodiesterase